MSNEKYYTPDISEFHVGFFYEYNSNVSGKQNWSKWVVSEYADFQVMKNDIPNYRVKHLDHDDIVSLGWELTIYGYEGVGKAYKIKDSENKLIQLTHFTNDIIQIHDVYSGECLFSGHLLNKSELSRLMRQLGITKNEQP